MEEKLGASEPVTGLVKLAQSSLRELKARLLQKPSILEASDISQISSFGQKLAHGEMPRLENLLSYNFV